jgi:hypothetical protein
MTRDPIPSWSASMLRQDLSERAHRFAGEHNLLHDVSLGDVPSVIFGRDEHGLHGNFHPESYRSICGNPAWLRRLAKAHTASRRSRARKDWRWMELDSSNSSDALLMNIFCHPGVYDGDALATAVANMLGVELTARPCFGIRPGVPLRSGLIDRTEIDLQLNDVFLEAKLTESDFQTARPELIERYRDLEAVFEVSRLPRRVVPLLPSHPLVEDYSQLEEPPAEMTFDRVPSRTLIESYQLIRDVLAAYAADASFCLLLDARRCDLIELWYGVLSAVNRPTFACRLRLLTWQDLASALPDDLQQFLDLKYGIV